MSLYAAALLDLLVVLTCAILTWKYAISGCMISLIYYVQWAGFEDVRQMEFRQSHIGSLADIEFPGRVMHAAGIYIEGIKLLA